MASARCTFKAQMPDLFDSPEISPVVITTRETDIKSSPVDPRSSWASH